MKQPSNPKPKRQPALALTGSDESASDGDAFARIAATLGDDTSATDLARPALILASDEYPGLNIQRYLNRLDDLADEALQNVVIGARTDCEAARRLASFLAERCGFRGAPEGGYYDHRNSMLCDVLDRKIGIPITLSLLLIEVGRRLGMPLVGIGFPGHFLVGCGPHRRNEYLLLDPYCEGKVVDWDECEMRLQALGMEFDPELHLSPITNRDFFARMLGNLRAIYMRHRDTPRVLRTISRLTMLDDDFVSDYKQYAAMLANDGDFEGARLCLRSYLDVRDDDSKDSETARQLLSHLLDLRAMRN